MPKSLGPLLACCSAAAATCMVLYGGAGTTTSLAKVTVCGILAYTNLKSMWQGKDDEEMLYSGVRVGVFAAGFAASAHTLFKAVSGKA